MNITAHFLRILKNSIIIFLFLAAILYIAGVTIVPTIGKAFLTGSLEKTFNCEVQIEHLVYLPYRGFSARKICFINKETGEDFVIKKARAQLSLAALLSGNIIVRDIYLRHRKIVFKIREFGFRKKKNTMNCSINSEMFSGSIQLMRLNESWHIQKISLYGRDSEFDAASTFSEGEIYRISAHGSVDISDVASFVFIMDGKEMLPVDIAGVVHISLDIENNVKEPFSMKGGGKVFSEMIRIGRFLIEGMEGALDFSGSKIIFRSWLLRFFKGYLNMDLIVDLAKEKTKRIEGEVRLKNVNLDEVTAALTGEKETFLGGILQISATIPPSGITPETIKADGHLRVSNGHFFEVDALKILYLVFRFIQPDMGKLVFRDISGDFSVLEGRVQSKNLFLDSNVISLKAIGALWFHGRVDCSFSIEPHYDESLVSSIMKAGVSLIAGQVIKLRMTGVIPYVTVNYDYIPVLDNIPGIMSFRKSVEQQGIIDEETKKTEKNNNY